jgi:hypothetical protein
MTTTAPTTYCSGGQPDVAVGRDTLSGSGGSQPPGLRERKARRARAALIDAAVKLCLGVGS